MRYDDEKRELRKEYNNILARIGIKPLSKKAFHRLLQIPYDIVERRIKNEVHKYHSFTKRLNSDSGKH